MIDIPRTSEGRFVSVYGTLKEGLSNHKHFLSGYRFVGYGKTTDRYDMKDTGGFPVIFRDGTYPVSVEVYEVDTKGLKDLDRLEGEGSMYLRILQDVQMLDGSVVTTSIYVGSPSFWRSGRSLREVTPDAMGELNWRPIPYSERRRMYDASQQAGA